VIRFLYGIVGGVMMRGQRGFWDVETRLQELSADGDPQEKLSATVDFELFRPVLTQALRRGDPSKGGRPGFDPVLKFKMLVLQALHGLSLQQTDYLVRDRLSWMRFCGLGPGDTVPDANTLWNFREALIAAGAVPESWQSKPAKLRQKDRGGRWRVKFSNAKPKADATPQVDITIPVFGTKSHISIDRRHGVIRSASATDAASYDGARLHEGLIDPSNTASDVWADTAYRSAVNEAYLSRAGKRSRIHRKKPQGRAMPRAHAAKSTIRARVEHGRCTPRYF